MFKAIMIKILTGFLKKEFDIQILKLMKTFKSPRKVRMYLKKTNRVGGTV